MPSNYDAIRRENERKYGADIQRIGGMLLADRYDDRTHFIYEVLQNTEDALKKRGDAEGSSTINFALAEDSLTISHYGKPFDEADVRGVCGIAESTKEELSSIGRFGIGFKSVYAFTDSPEIHSGDERFAIDSFVWPRGVSEKVLHPAETQIRIPFNKELADGGPAIEQVLDGLRRLRPRTLLFLRQITQITWSVNGSAAGGYQRQDLEQLTEKARKVRVTDTAGSVEDWIVFSREVPNQGVSAGYVELAFALEPESGEGPTQAVQRLQEDPPLVVFFPTVLSTHLGFIVQGPYRTTPSRDNVPQSDPWNRKLVADTSQLLVDALKELRRLGLLGVSAIETLPLDATAFSESSQEGRRFAPMFQAVKETLLNKRRLPAYGGGHIAGKNAKLAGTQNLRQLLGPEQLAGLFPGETNLGWLSDSITINRTPVLHKYLREELGITDIDAEWLVSRLTKEFLEAQPDEWIQRLYEFLNNQKGALGNRQPPLVRLESGAHTVAFVENAPQAYLPGKVHTNFPTVKSSVCQSAVALEFLQGLGLKEFDQVEYVIRNILPKYEEQVNVSDDEYQAHLEQAIVAFDSAKDDENGRKRLREEIGKVKFAIAVDAATNARQFVQPGEAYWPTERLKTLFKDVPGVLLLDYDPAKSYYPQGSRERIRALLEAAGARDYLVPIPAEPALTEEEWRVFRIRRDAGQLQDRTLRGLDSLLDVLSDLPDKETRSQELWTSLGDVQSGEFTGSYEYLPGNNRTNYRKEWFTASFVRKLNKVAWVPGANGELHPPGKVLFRDTKWEDDALLRGKIEFLSDAHDQVAKEFGIDTDALEYVLAQMSRRGITTLAKSQEFLRDLSDATPQAGGTTEQVSSGDPQSNLDQVTTKRAAAATSGQTTRNDRATDGPGQGGQPLPRISISLRTSSDGSSGNGSGDGNLHNREVENAAIKLILEKEPSLKRTKYGNHGFDLWEPGGNDEPVQLNEAEDWRELEWELGPNDQPKRWIEVKSTSGETSSVSLSITQFRFALEKQCDYWLYVVVNATTEGAANISRIKNPAQRILNTIGDFNLYPAWVEEHQSRDNPQEG